MTDRKVILGYGECGIILCPLCAPECATWQYVPDRYLHIIGGEMDVADESCFLRLDCEICGKQSTVRLHTHKGELQIKWAPTAADVTAYQEAK
jgi:hypothetical protein